MTPFRILATLTMLASVAFGKAVALEATGVLGDLSYAVYGPDWTWQKRDLNVMAVLQNTGVEPVVGILRMALPDTEPLPFATQQPLMQTFQVPAGETLRLAFTQIQASDLAPRGMHDLAIGISTYGNVAEIPYRVRTIRGAAMNPGKWALLLPVLLTVLWSALLFWVLRRMGGTGAWRTPGAPFQPNAET